MNSILDQVTDDNILTLLKGEEKQAQDDTLKPSKFFEEYQKSGNPIFKEAALTQHKSLLTKIGLGVAGVAALATPKGRTMAGEALIKEAPKVGHALFQGFKDISTNVLEKLKGRSEVSKQFLEDTLKQADVRGADKEMVRSVLDEMPNPEKDVTEVLGRNIASGAYGQKSGDIWPNDITPERFDYLKKYRPDKPVTLYRGILPKEAREGNDSNPYFTSWTDNYDVADYYAGKGEMGGRVLTKTFQPDDILVEINKLPESVRKDLANNYSETNLESLMSEGEHIVMSKKGKEALAKKSNILGPTSDKISVPDFAEKVKEKILPLKIQTSSNAPSKFISIYENISLPDEVKGNVSNYSEHVYESPIKTSAGQVHFSNSFAEPTNNYFAHTRVEDMAPQKHNAFLSSESTDKTRRVIEIQSDLFQKGRLESENALGGKYTTPELANAFREAGKLIDMQKARDAEIAKLKPYEDTWHERVIREEVKQASKDGMTKLQFPTGETAMKIEGLGDNTIWFKPRSATSQGGRLLRDYPVKKGMEIVRGNEGSTDAWIITDVLEGSKFKAVPKSDMELAPTAGTMDEYGRSREDFINSRTETFDISGKVDRENPIYKFYDSKVAKFLKNKFNAKPITDDKGVTWLEVDPRAYQEQPVLAHGAKVPIGSILGLGGSVSSMLASDPLEYTKDTNKQERKQLNDKAKGEHKTHELYVVPDRNVIFTPHDVQELKPVIFAEVSNRTPDKQELEVRTILNTALNRIQQFKEKGIDKTLTEVLQMPNQYQGYLSKQYKLFKKGSGSMLDSKKVATTSALVDKVLKEIMSGEFKDNTNGAAFYVHKPNGSIEYDNTKPLFK